MDSLSKEYRNLPHPGKAHCSEFAFEHLGKLYCRPGDVVVDVGANFGAHTVTFCKAVGSTGKVIAFEPNPTVAKKLMQFRRPYPWLTVREVALSDLAGHANFFATKISGFGSLYASDRTDFEGENIAVLTDTLDSALAEDQLSSLSFIKIDVEGAELPVLRGGIDTARKFDPLIAIEVSWKRIDGDSDTSRVDFFDFVSKFGSTGYALYDICGNTINYSEKHEYNLLLVPKSASVGFIFEITRNAVREYLSSDRKWYLYKKFEDK